MISKKISTSVVAGVMFLAPMALTAAVGAQPQAVTAKVAEAKPAVKATAAQDRHLPMLKSPKALSISDVSTSGATVSWSAVSNNVGYLVRLYTASGQSNVSDTVESDVTSYVFDGLDGSTEYRVSVQALGDGVHFRSSPQSGKASFVTTGSLTYNIGDVGPGGGIVFYASATPFTSVGSACNTACHYLEFAPKGWATTSAVPEDVTYNGQVIRTRTDANVDPILVWSDGAFTGDGSGSNVISIGTAIGTGMLNTTQMAANTVTTGKGMRFAFQAAQAYAGNATAGEWFLPSMDELNELCKFVSGQTADLGTSVQCAPATSLWDAAYGISSDELYWSSSYPFIEGVGRNPAWGQTSGYFFTTNPNFQGSHIANSTYNGYYSSYGNRFRPIRAFG